MFVLNSKNHWRSTNKMAKKMKIMYFKSRFPFCGTKLEAIQREYYAKTLTTLSYSMLNNFRTI
jgi:hypothetical protein